MVKRFSLAALLLAASAPLLADTTWTLTNVTFADGGTASGFYVRREFPTAVVVDWSITVAGGNTTTFPSVAYTPANSVPVAAGSFTQFRIGPLGGGRTLLIGTNGGLPENGGSVPILLGSNSVECFNCSPARNITGGSLQGVVGPGGEQRYERYLPIAGSVTGASGDFFRTNVRIFNASTVAATAKVYFLPLGQDNSAATPKEYSIGPRTMLELNDAVGLLGGTGLGALRVGSNTELQVTGQVFTDSKCTVPTAGGLYGQFVPSTPRELALNEGVILHLRSDAQARSNIGFANPTSTAATVNFLVYGTDDQQIGGLGSLNVPPYSATAPTNLESVFGPIGRDSVWVYFVTNQPVIGYGSVVDAKTADQYFSPAIRD